MGPTVPPLSSFAVLGFPIQTSSLVLRHFTFEDVSRILELNAEPSTRHWLPSHVYADCEEAKAALEFLIASYLEPGHPQRGPYVLAIEQRSTKQLIGHVGFSPLNDEVEVSYAVAEFARGQGFGVEALDHACDWISQTFRLPGLIAVTAAVNIGSRRVLQRARFAHIRDEAMRFQGVHQIVSRYRRGAAPVGCGGA